MCGAIDRVLMKIKGILCFITKSSIIWLFSDTIIPYLNCLVPIRSLTNHLGNQSSRYQAIQIHLTDAFVKGHDLSGRQNKRRQHPLKMKVTYI